MMLAPCSLKEARHFVATNHRHHRPPPGHKFSLKAVVDTKTVGVVIVGHPVARHEDQIETLEIVRLCTDGTTNACSFLIGAAKRAARALGYKRLISYTLIVEDGASWKASGMTKSGTSAGGSWYRERDAVRDGCIKPLFDIPAYPTSEKQKWEIAL